MKRKIKKFLAITSIVIIVLGILLGIGLSTQLLQSVSGYSDIYIDGSDFTDFAKILGTFGSVILGIAIVFYSFMIVGIIWAFYGILLLITKIFQKITEKHSEL